MKRYIKSTTIIPNKKIQVGMFWNVDGHDFTVTKRNGDTCKIQESWITEDTGRSRSVTEVYKIDTNDNGTEFAHLGDNDKWGFYATSAFNYPYESSSEKYPPIWDKYWYEDDEDGYIPSATRGDYSPSSPWDAPGMSVSDFI